MGGAQRGRVALVAGAGPGGICATIALHKCEYDVRLFERAPSLESIAVGGGIHLWNNATRALDELGVLAPVLDVGVRIERFGWRTSKGRPLGVGNVAGLTATVGTPALGLSRQDLHAALSSALPDGALELGRTATGFRESDGSVSLTFDGDDEARGDLLVGADGAGSVVRRELRRPIDVRYSGVVNVQGISPVTDAAPEATYGMLWGCGTRFGHYPVRGGVFWYALITAPAGGPPAPNGLRRAVLDEVGRWVEPAPSLVESTPDDAISCADLSGRDPTDVWGEGRVTLLGDAAHAMTPFMGQGAGQALEDAAVLGRTVREHDDVAAALRDYEQRRRKRTADVTRRSWRVGQGTRMRNPVVCAVRNRIVRRIYNRAVWPEFVKTITADY